MAQMIDPTFSSQPSLAPRDHSWTTHHIQSYRRSARLLGYSCWTAGASTMTLESVVSDLRALERNENSGKCVVRNSTIRSSNGWINCHRGSSISSYSSVTPYLSPPLQERLNVYTGIPIAYPRMVFLENALSSKLNPLASLARSGSFSGLKGFVNKFNGDPELLDDLVLICFPTPLKFLANCCFKE